jgi:hypothetical protein
MPISSTSTTALLVAPTFGTDTGGIVETTPSGMSTERFTNTDITANTWFTTKYKDSTSSIVLPVIWCPKRGGNGAAILLWIPKFPT